MSVQRFIILRPQRFINPPPPTSDDLAKQRIEEDIIRENMAREFLFNDDDYNHVLNRDFTLDKVQKIVSHAKSGKAPGIDGQ